MTVRLLSTQPIAQGLASLTLSLSKTLSFTRLFANTTYQSSGYCPHSPSWKIVPSLYIRLREVSLLLMAIFNRRLFLPLPDYYSSFSAINLCLVDTNHSQDNGHSLTLTIAYHKDVASLFLVLLADDLFISTLTAIARNHTRHFMIINHTTNHFHIQDKCISQTIYLYCHCFQVLRVRITRLLILPLILPAVCLAMSIANCLASITECSNTSISLLLPLGDYV